MLGNLPLLAAACLAAAPGDARSAADYAPLSQCVVSLIDEVELPARVAGVLMSLSLEDGTQVKEGLRVTAKQMLGRLDDADALARQRAAELDHRVAIAEEKKSQSSIAAADATVDVARAEVEESDAINRKARGTIPATQLRRQQLTERRAKMEAEVARNEQETAALTIELRAAQLELTTINVNHHQLQSPLDGTVVQLYKHVGEWVNPGDAIMRIVYLDRLRVEGFVNIQSFLPEEVAGQPVRIEVQCKDRKEPFDSVISFVSPLVEASGEYRVWAEVQNREVSGHPLLRPGMSAEMFIQLRRPATAPARSASTR